MNKTAPDHNAIAACRHCHAPIQDAPHLRENDEYCCEGCFLAERKQQTLAAAVDDAPSVLAEALVAALDAREHAPGNRSSHPEWRTVNG